MYDCFERGVGAGSSTVLLAGEEQALAVGSWQLGGQLVLSLVILHGVT